MRYIAFGMLVFGLGLATANAQGRGIGVTPSEIEIGHGVDWPYTVPLTVTNFSTQEEHLQVQGAAASPGRFSLGAGKSRRVLVTLEEPARSTEGVIKVLSKGTSSEGFITGTGIRIPYSIEKENENAVFLAKAASGPGAFSWALGSGIILVTLILLWQIAGVVRSWMLNSSKQ